MSAIQIRSGASLVFVCLLLFAGGDVEQAKGMQLRYASERWTHRASLRRAVARELDKSAARPAWRDVAYLYERALVGLPPLKGRERPETALEFELSRLTNRAVLGRMEALSALEQYDDALQLGRLLLAESRYWPGTRGRAALEIARVLDRAGRWDEALQVYKQWCEGITRGDWPLHRTELEVASYVSHRLSDRGQYAARRAWVSLAAISLEAAARRGEYSRDARYSCFVLLLNAQHWEAALVVLRLTRELHDPQGADGGLVLAEANLLAGEMNRPEEAMGLLFGLYDENSTYNVRYRVAGSLLAGQIQARRGGLDRAQQHYERAIAQARSSMGRAEATLGLARVHAARGNIEQASRYYTQLRNAWPSTSAGLLASLEEYRMLSERDKTLQAEGVLSQAMSHYRTVIVNFGTELPALQAAGYLSEVLGRSKSWDEGVAFLDSMAESFSTDPRAGSLLLRAARISVDRLDDPDRARVLLHRVSQRYPQSDLVVAIQPFVDSLRSSLDTP